jgi:hypothetical protein
MSKREEPDCPSVPCGYRFVWRGERHFCDLPRHHDHLHRCACGDYDQEEE